MNIRLEKLAIPDLAIVRSAIFRDARGYFMETWSRDAFSHNGIDTVFVQENQSLSIHKNTVRGLHLQLRPYQQAKLVRVLCGSIMDVAVDLRKSSQSYLGWCAVTLRAGDGRQVFIPRGFAHGFLTLEANTVVSYKVDAPYAPSYEAGLRWNDERIGITWPVTAQDVVLSERDKRLPNATSDVLAQL